MEVRTPETEVHVPSDHVAIVARFADRDAANAAVDALLAQRFTDDQLSVVARGATTDESGAFVPGGLMVTVTAKGREADAERILKQHAALEVTTNRVGATGTVGEETT